MLLASFNILQTVPQTNINYLQFWGIHYKKAIEFMIIFVIFVLKWLVMSSKMSMQ